MICYTVLMISLPLLKNKIGAKSKPTSNQDNSAQNNYLSVDIGTEYLKVLRFGITDEGVEIRDVSVVHQQQHAMDKGVILSLETVIENIRLAIHEVSSGTEDLPIDGMVLGLAGEYIQGVSIVVNYDRAKKASKEVSEKEEVSVIKKIQEQIMNSGKEDLSARTGLSVEDIEILHVTLTGISIGGIHVDNLVGHTGQDVQLTFYASFAPKTYVKALQKLSKELGIDIVGVVSQPFAVARAFKRSREKDFSAIFIDIGGGTTDVAVVQAGSVLDTQMFAFGGRVFTKEIARRMNIDYRHAELRKLKFSEGKVAKSIYRQVYEIVSDVTAIWLNLLQSALEEVEDVEVLPDEIYLCGGGSSLPNIRKSMLAFPWKELLPFANIPKVKHFEVSDLLNVTDKSGKLNAVYHITPAALAVYAYDKMNSPTVYNDMKK